MGVGTGGGLSGKDNLRMNARRVMLEVEQPWTEGQRNTAHSFFPLLDSVESSGNWFNGWMLAGAVFAGCCGDALLTSSTPPQVISTSPFYYHTISPLMGHCKRKPCGAHHVT